MAAALTYASDEQGTLAQRRVQEGSCNVDVEPSARKLKAYIAVDVVNGNDDDLSMFHLVRPFALKKPIRSFAFLSQILDELGEEFSNKYDLEVILSSTSVTVTPEDALKP